MSNVLQLIGAFAAGAALALGFLWGLWITIRGIERARRPALRMLGSMLVRFAAVLIAFYVLIRLGGWPYALAAAAGFTLVRLVVAWRTSTDSDRQGVSS